MTPSRANTTWVRWFGQFVAIPTMLGTLLVASPVQADLDKPRNTDRHVTLTVTQILSSAHMSRHELDDEISKRWLDNFLTSLDPLKLYFYKQDVDYFKQSETKLDDWGRRGDISFAYDIFKTYLQRVDERVEYALEFLDEKHDFTVDEEMTIKPEAAQYAQNPQQAKDIWRKRIKYDLLVLKADKEDPKEAIDRLKRRYRSFSQRMHLSSADDLLERYLTSMTTSYDPHTTYMSPDTLENFQIQMRAALDGIGASLRFEDGYTIVTEIVPGGAAARDGRLKPEDRVVAVGQGKDGPMEDVVSMGLSDVVHLIRGERGSVVRLEVISEGKKERKVIDITRDKIELTGSEARQIILEAGKKPDGSPYKIGVINLPSFYMDMQAAQEGKSDYKSTTRDVLEILNNKKDGFKAQGVDALVMDLRLNGGGSLSEAIKLTGLFIDEGPVVQVKDFRGNVEEHDDTDAGVAWKGPLVVLTSTMSASASEIFAAAIQDYNRGIVVGDDRTHGKGTVQSLLDLGQQLFPGANPPNLGALKLTMQQFYRPAGESTQKVGVTPDIELPSVRSHFDSGEESLDYAIEADKIRPADFDKVAYVNDNVLNQLRATSNQRVYNNEDFQKVIRNIQKWLEKKDRTTISLNEEKFFEDQEDDDEEKEEEEEYTSYNRPVVERDFYFEEVLSITVDYLQMFNVADVRKPAATKNAPQVR
ncbi:Periplasmic tail-specific proteinase [Planctomycetales bacterium 10988]|nr:Periplasmic tail-specific proteinase [Planctomycetales bacterium 10988]